MTNRRTTILTLTLTGAALVAVVMGAFHVAGQERAALIEQFAVSYLEQVEEIARKLKEDFDDIEEDLRFAGQLVQAADSAPDRERELGALLAVVKQYRLVEVYDPQGRSLLSVNDPLAGSRIERGDYALEMAEVIREALTRAPGALTTSPPLAADPSGWLRVFATALPPAPSRSGAAAIAVLVDTREFFGEVQLVASRPTSHLLLLGSHGRPIPTTDRALSAALARRSDTREEVPGYAALIERMRGGAHGTLLFAEEEASYFGFGRAKVVAAYTPIPLQGGGHWSAAILTSTAELQGSAQAITLRIGMITGLLSLGLLTLAGYVVTAARRAALVRERLRRAEELAHLHEKTEKILDNIPTGVMALSEGEHVTAVNQALRARLPQGVGATLEVAFPRGAVEHLRKLLESARRSHRVQSLFGAQLVLFFEEGQYNLHAVPLEPRFPEARFLLVIEDLSELRSLQTQLLRAEKLATVGVLAVGIAHEIGTPLGVIRGRAEYTLGKLGEAHPQAGGFRVIIDQIDLISRTIRELLDFTRAKPAAVRPVALALLVAAVFELLRFESQRRKVRLERCVPEDLPLLAADPDQLQQVLVNLVMNSCDACIKGGRVEITAASVLESRKARIEVIDDGCGIPEENRHQIFDPFFTTKKRGQGTGLGLTIAAQIIRTHGGQIEVESEPGRGTRVTLLWPLAPAPEEKHASIL